MSLPVVTIEGRMVADPELRFAPSGIAVAKFRLVASSRKKNESGEWVDDRTLWINVTSFKQLAEHVAESLGKGDLVVCTGRLQTDEWTTESGEKRSQTALVADTVGASLQFRTIKHGEGQVARSSGQQANDPWAATGGQAEEPPF